MAFIFCYFAVFFLLSIMAIVAIFTTRKNDTDPALAVFIVSVCAIIAGMIDLGEGKTTKKTYRVHNIENKQIVVVGENIINLNKQFDRIFDEEVALEVYGGGYFLTIEPPKLKLIEPKENLTQ